MKKPSKIDKKRIREMEETFIDFYTPMDDLFHKEKPQIIQCRNCGAEYGKPLKICEVCGKEITVIEIVEGLPGSSFCIAIETPLIPDKYNLNKMGEKRKRLNK